MLGDTGGISVGEALCRGSVLTYCSLKKNDISDDGAIRIAQGIDQDARFLKEMHLGWNEISDIGGEYLGKVLLKNTTLNKLDLSNNKLKNTTAAVFIVSLKRNKYIKLLNLDDNMISSHLNKQIQAAIMANRGKGTEQKIV
jgi:Ran GTPase-activating protein (RanGAP) involved in mRNA processing and transport